MDDFNKIVEKIFKIPVGEIRDTVTSNDVPDWDSMNYLMFISELEKVFGFQFGMNDVINAKTLGDIRRIVEQNKKK